MNFQWRKTGPARNSNKQHLLSNSSEPRNVARDASEKWETIDGRCHACAERVANIQKGDSSLTGCSNERRTRRGGEIDSIAVSSGCGGIQHLTLTAHLDKRIGGGRTEVGINRPAGKVGEVSATYRSHYGGRSGLQPVERSTYTQRQPRHSGVELSKGIHPTVEEPEDGANGRR